MKKLTFLSPEDEGPKQRRFLKRIVRSALATTLAFVLLGQPLAALTHRVQSGESWWSIANRYKVNMTELATVNGKRTSDVIYSGQTLTIPGTTTPSPAPTPTTSGSHVVQRGESWWSISSKYGVNMTELARINGKTTTAYLYTGQVLKIPGRTTTVTPTPTPSTGTKVHVVQRGESWWSIATLYGLDYKALAAANGKSPTSYVYTGQRLTIPGTSAPTQPAPTPTPTTSTPALYHTVVRGESWWSIATKYGMTYPVLAQLNNRSSSSTLYVGERLLIRKGTTAPTPVPTKAPVATPVPTKAPVATPVPTKAPVATPVPTNPLALPEGQAPAIAVPTPGPSPAPLLPYEAPVLPPTSDVRYNVSLNQLSAHVNTTIDGNNFVSWPAELTTPYKLNVDVSALVGRAKGINALKGVVVILDAGHGGTDPGATATYNGSLVREAALNTKVANLAKAELEKLGATVIMSRTQDTYRSLYGRIYLQGKVALDIWENELKKVNANTQWITNFRKHLVGMDVTNVDDSWTNEYLAEGQGVSKEMRMLMDMQYQLKNVIFVSIHTNAMTTSEPNGNQIYLASASTIGLREKEMDSPIVNPQYGRHNDISDKKLAQTMYNSITSQIPELVGTNSGVMDNMAFALLRHSAYPSIFNEMAFMTNAQDLEKIMTPSIQQRMAVAVADGVYRYFSTP